MDFMISKKKELRERQEALDRALEEQARAAEAQRLEQVQQQAAAAEAEAQRLAEEQGLLRQRALAEQEVGELRIHEAEARTELEAALQAAHEVDGRQGRPGAAAGSGGV